MLKSFWKRIFWLKSSSLESCRLKVLEKNTLFLAVWLATHKSLKTSQVQVVELKPALIWSAARFDIMPHNNKRTMISDTIMIRWIFNHVCVSSFIFPNLIISLWTNQILQISPLYPKMESSPSRSLWRLPDLETNKFFQSKTTIPLKKKSHTRFEKMMFSHVVLGPLNIQALTAKKQQQKPPTRLVSQANPRYPEARVLVLLKKVKKKMCLLDCFEVSYRPSRRMPRWVSIYYIIPGIFKHIFRRCLNRNLHLSLLLGGEASPCLVNSKFGWVCCQELVATNFAQPMVS